MPTSVHLIGLKLRVSRAYHSGMDEGSEQWPYVPWLIKVFHSQLFAFPHLRIAELGSNLEFFQFTVRNSPEISQLPVPGWLAVYRWACPSEDLETQSEVSARYSYAGLDPATLEPSGMSIVFE